MEAKRKICIRRRLLMGFEKQDSNLRRYMIAKVLALGLIFLIAGPFGMTVPAVANGDLSFHKIKVMTQNMYVGADIFRPATAETLDEFYQLLDETFDVLGSTKIYERAQAMAKEVARHRPHLIGLQEVYQIQRQNLDMDYLLIFEQALADQGLNYSRAGSVQNLNLTIPILINNTVVDLVTLIDRDVILARDDVIISDVSSGNYFAELPVPLPLDPPLDILKIKRGYVAVHATIEGITCLFVNTHLELRGKDLLPDGDPGIVFVSGFQVAQAKELLKLIEDEPGLVIVVGDFNSDPRDPVLFDPLLSQRLKPPYKQFSFNGYRDSWLINLLRPLNYNGYTCCQDETLDNAVSALDERIDHIFYKPKGLSFPLVGPVLAVVVGDEPGDKTDTSPALWPSDHGGVVATKFVLTF